MMTRRAPHQPISSIPNLLVNHKRLFPGGNQYITPAAIIESGTDPPSVARFEMRQSQLVWADHIISQLVQTSGVGRHVRVPIGVDHSLAKYALGPLAVPISDSQASDSGRQTSRSYGRYYDVRRSTQEIRPKPTVLLNENTETLQ